MKYSKDGGLTLSTGKEVSANCGIIGLSPDGRVFGGYDDARVDEKLTPHERRELADYMIAKWRDYKIGEMVSWDEGNHVQKARSEYDDDRRESNG